MRTHEQFLQKISLIRLSQILFSHFFQHVHNSFSMLVIYLQPCEMALTNDLLASSFEKLNNEMRNKY